MWVSETKPWRLAGSSGGGGFRSADISPAGPGAFSPGVSPPNRQDSQHSRVTRRRDPSAALRAGSRRASRLPEVVVGVVGVDTFQRLDYTMSAEQARERAEVFRDDYRGSLKQMVSSLFHPDAGPAVVADAEQRMTGTPGETAYQMFLSLGGYDLPASARRLAVALRAKANQKPETRN